MYFVKTTENLENAMNASYRKARSLESTIICINSKRCVNISNDKVEVFDMEQNKIITFEAVFSSKNGVFTNLLADSEQYTIQWTEFREQESLMEKFGNYNIVTNYKSLKLGKVVDNKSKIWGFITNRNIFKDARAFGTVFEAMISENSSKLQNLKTNKNSEGTPLVNNNV